MRSDGVFAGKFYSSVLFVPIIAHKNLFFNRKFEFLNGKIAKPECFRVF